MLSPSAILHIVADLLADELARSRGRDAASLGAGGWTADTRVDGAGLDLDSLERLDAAAALSEYFHLHEAGTEDGLLATRTLGEWAELVAASLRLTSGRITVRTSGSTGKPRRCTHRLETLRREAEGWAAMFEPCAIVGLVPAHHIYGAIFTALLPDILGLPVAAARHAPARALAQAAPGTLIVATPTLWAFAARTALRFAPGLSGVTSAAAMPAQLWHQLRAQGLARLVEIYGSSETAGIGHRAGPGDAFALLDRWSRGADGLRDVESGEEVALPDRVRWLDDRHLVPDGRRDGAVQIGGTNVFPERVRRRLLEHARVADAAVRLDADTGRLKAFVVPAAGGSDGLPKALDDWCGDALRDVERPRRIACGAALPRGAMGKLADW